MKPWFILLLMLSVNFEKSKAQDTSKVSQLSFFEKGNINGYVFYQCGRVIDFNKNSDGSLDFSKTVYRFKNALGLNIGVHLFEYVYFRGTFYWQMNRSINAPWA